MSTLQLIWQLPAREYRNQGMISLRLMTVLAALGLGIVALLIINFANNNRQTVIVLSVPSAGLALYGWYRFVASMVRVCSPINLRTTPRLRRNVLLATSLLWLGLSMLLATFFTNPYMFCFVVWALAAAMTQPSDRVRSVVFICAALWVAYALPSITLKFVALDEPALWETPKTMLMMCAVTGSLLGLAGMFAVFPRAASLVCIAWVGSMFVSKPWLGMTFTELLRLIYSLSSQFATHMMVALALLGLTLFGLVGINGERLINRHQRNNQTQRKNEAKRDSAFQTPRQRPAMYRHFLKRVLQQHESRDKPRELLPITFGPVMHWTSAISETAWIVALLIVGPYLFSFAFKSLGHAELTASWLLILPVTLVTFLAATERELHRTHREQRMLTLTPGWPAPAAVKSIFTNWLIQYVGALFVCFALMVLCSAWVHDLSYADFMQPLMTLLLTALIFFGTALRSYTTRRQSGFTRLLQKMAVGMTPFLLLQVTKIFRGPVELVAAIAFVFCLGFVVYRWRRFNNGPAVLPASPP